eukprot:TRINITY_DN16767_c0_g2_i1.p1 TRINITY_DN16767_c0_g2~~TRINITY_DN16767_c0_g2_i1.p1  ORF type:complete len:532 (+),score=176.94 TRINITY_DN16767_c0_g2_i1:71-1666(+)
MAAVPRKEFKLELWPLQEKARARLTKKLVDIMLENIATYWKDEAKAQPTREELTEIARKIEEEAFQDVESRGSTAAAVTELEGEGATLKNSTAQLLEYSAQLTRRAVEATRPPSVRALMAGEAAAPLVETVLPQLLEEFSVSKAGEKREVLTEEKAKDLLQPLLDTKNLFSKVRLSGKSYTRGAAAIASQGLARLSNSKTLKTLDMSDIIAGREEVEALDVLKEICSGLAGSELLSLNVSDNALGEKGLRACMEAFVNQKYLEHVYFCNIGVSAEAAETIANMLPAPHLLRTLHFFKNMTGDEGAMSLAKLVAAAKNLEDFRCSATRINLEGGEELFHALMAGDKLLKLDLKDNMFEGGGPAIAALIRQHIQLRIVDLGDTSLGSEGIVAVAESLKESVPLLEVLDLGGNEVGEGEAAEAVAECVKEKAHLRRLVLNDNELADEGAISIAHGITSDGCSALEELDLCTNEIGASGAIAVAEAVARLQNFKLLKLNGNRIPTAAIAAIQSILSRSPGGIEALGPLDENEEQD